MVKNPPANAGDIRDTGSIPGLGRSTGGGHGNPLQYCCLENPMDRGAWWAMFHRVTKSWTQLKRLSMLSMQCVYVNAAKSLQSCPTLSDPTDCSLPGSSVHGIFQARVLEWGAISFANICQNHHSIYLLSLPLCTHKFIFYIYISISALQICSSVFFP